MSEEKEMNDMSMDEMREALLLVKEENNRLKSEKPSISVTNSSSSLGSNKSENHLTEAEILLGKLSLEDINRKLSIQKISSSIHLDANQRGMKLNNPRIAAELMNYKSTIIEYLNGKKLLFTILDKYNGRDLLNDINNIYLLVKEEAKIIVYNFLKATIADRIRQQYASDANKCDPRLLWRRLMTADVEEVNLPGVKKAKSTLLDAIDLQFNEQIFSAAQHFERIEKAFAEYAHLVQYYRECGKNAVPIDNDDLSVGDKIVVLLNSITKAAKNEKAYQQLHRDLLKVKTYEAGCDEFRNAVGSRQTLLAQLYRSNQVLSASNDWIDMTTSSTDAINVDNVGVANSVKRSCINCGKEGHSSGYKEPGENGKWIYTCNAKIIQCPRCNRWGHQENFCRTRRIKCVPKDLLPDPNISTSDHDQSDNDDDDHDDNNNQSNFFDGIGGKNKNKNKNNVNQPKEEVSGGRLRHKLIGKSSLCVAKLISNYREK